MERGTVKGTDRKKEGMGSKKKENKEKNKTENEPADDYLFISYFI